MITLPWPPKELSPNARVHFMAKARATKAYKFDCWATLAAHRSALRGRTDFKVTFHPPSARHFDRDNLIARFKAGQDALSDITGIDDSKFVMTYARGEPIKGGQVVIA
jgi:crossover junction endodeoxyribonuclease RusA